MDKKFIEIIESALREDDIAYIKAEREYIKRLKAV